MKCYADKIKFPVSDIALSGNKQTRWAEKIKLYIFRHRQLICLTNTLIPTCKRFIKEKTLRFFLFSDEFRSKVACENEKVQLKCNPNSRVAVYSASYGRTEYESIQCPQPQGVREESKFRQKWFRSVV